MEEAPEDLLGEVENGNITEEIGEMSSLFSNV
jgi:hypothetical protein